MRLRGFDIHRELEQMLRSEARFRGLQEPVLQAIMKHQSLGNNKQPNMKHQSPIVVVMGTGVGKTLCFQFPAQSKSSGTTVVISTLISLQEHMVERFQRADISCIHASSEIPGVAIPPARLSSPCPGGIVEKIERKRRRASWTRVRIGMRIIPMETTRGIYKPATEAMLPV